MKIQDILFFAIFILLFFIKKPRYFAVAGFICLFISIPLFAKWIFFTAARLTWYAWAFFFICAVLHLIEIKKSKN